MYSVLHCNVKHFAYSFKIFLALAKILGIFLPRNGQKWKHSKNINLTRNVWCDLVGYILLQFILVFKNIFKMDLSRFVYARYVFYRK